MARWSVEQYADYLGGKTKHKYGAKPQKKDGKYFASKAEKFRWDELELLEKAGAISNLQFQPTFILTKAKIKYRADYEYDQEGEHIVEDIKGVWTSRFRMIAALWKYYGPCRLRVTKRKGNHTIIFKEIMPVALDIQHIGAILLV